jgi:hypothetical protein
MKENPVRAKYRKLVEHRLFELTVFLVIIYSCILMVLADPNKVRTFASCLMYSHLHSSLLVSCTDYVFYVRHF